MSKKEIFIYALKKAEHGGYNYLNMVPVFSPKNFTEDKMMTLLFGIHEKIIFDHNFCRALWGDDEIKYDSVGIAEIPGFKNTGVAWKIHLIRMTFAEDRLEYIKNNITIDI